MFEYRQNFLLDAFEFRRQHNHSNKEFKRSIFLPPELYNLSNLTHSQEDFLTYVINHPIDKLRFIFIPINHDDEFDDYWKLIFIDIKLKLVSIIDPKKRFFNQERINLIFKSVIEILSKLLINNGTINSNDWKCEMCKVSYFTKIENNYNSGVFLIAAIYSIVQDVPMYFKEEDCTALRQNFSNWLKDGGIPFHV